MRAGRREEGRGEGDLILAGKGGILTDSVLACSASPRQVVSHVFPGTQEPGTLHINNKLILSSHILHS